jgi:hypothetical protein
MGPLFSTLVYKNDTADLFEFTHDFEMVKVLRLSRCPNDSTKRA